MSSLKLLLSFTRHRNKELEKQHSVAGAANELDRVRDPAPRVSLACGHLTYGVDAEETIMEVHGLFERIIGGRVEVRASEVKRGVTNDYWLESEESKYGVMAPRHLAEEARKYFRLQVWDEGLDVMKGLA